MPIPLIILTKKAWYFNKLYTYILYKLYTYILYNMCVVTSDYTGGTQNFTELNIGR